MYPGGAYHQRHPSYQPGNPNYRLVTPASQYSPYAGQYPWYGTVWGVPTYNWGHFGVQPYPSAHSNAGWYTDVTQWGTWRRY
jgi:hypothetical protein